MLYEEYQKFKSDWKAKQEKKLNQRIIKLLHGLFDVITNSQKNKVITIQEYIGSLGYVYTLEKNENGRFILATNNERLCMEEDEVLEHKDYTLILDIIYSKFKDCY